MTNEIDWFSNPLPDLFPWHSSWSLQINSDRNQWLWSYMNCAVFTSITDSLIIATWSHSYCCCWRHNTTADADVTITMEYYWIGYIFLTMVLMVLTFLSFLRYHRHNEKQKEKKATPPGAGPRRKLHVVLGQHPDKPPGILQVELGNTQAQPEAADATPEPEVPKIPGPPDAEVGLLERSMTSVEVQQNAWCAYPVNIS